MNGLRTRHVAPPMRNGTASVPSCPLIHRVLRFSLCWVLVFSLAPTGCSPRSQAVLPRFRDVTKEAGIRFKHTSGAAGKKYFVETMGAGGAFLDYDNDGWLDILLLNGRWLHVGTSARQHVGTLARWHVSTLARWQVGTLA
ncbi:MAG: hypothetical protein NZT92_22695, partial [Abditibacteriales bacterium]|nr:hypothetical protein [Abditibacteriales bacterium]